MPTGRPKATLKLNEDKKRELTSLAHRSRSAPALARRARIGLACAEGHDNRTVARNLRLTPAIGRQVAQPICAGAVPPDREVHMVMDNYGTHKTPLICAWFAKRPRFHIHSRPLMVPG
jgi:hypothetical protein